MHGAGKGSRVVFTVVWTNWLEDCQATTVWRGTVNGAVLDTRWVLTYRDPSGAIKKMRGSDTFHRQ
jgi:hypothetical protein